MSVCHTPVLCLNGYTYPQSFFTIGYLLFYCGIQWYCSTFIYTLRLRNTLRYDGNSGPITIGCLISTKQVYRRRLLNESDHRPLEYLQTSHSQNPKIMRWSLVVTLSLYCEVYTRVRKRGCSLLETAVPPIERSMFHMMLVNTVVPSAVPSSWLFFLLFRRLSCPNLLIAVSWGFE